MANKEAPYFCMDNSTLHGTSINTVFRIGSSVRLVEGWITDLHIKAGNYVNKVIEHAKISMPEKARWLHNASLTRAHFDGSVILATTRLKTKQDLESIARRLETAANIIRATGDISAAIEILASQEAMLRLQNDES